MSSHTQIDTETAGDIKHTLIGWLFGMDESDATTRDAIINQWDALRLFCKDRALAIEGTKGEKLPFENVRFVPCNLENK